MNEACEEYHILISGCLDGELDESARLKLEEHTQGCAACRRELDAMKCLVVGTSAALSFEEWTGRPAPFDVMLEAAQIAQGW